MKKYSLTSLAEEITGLDEQHWDWDREYETVRRMDKAVRSIFQIKEVTDENKDAYIRVSKLLYKSREMRLLMNKYDKITKKVEIKDGVMIVPNEQKKLDNEDIIKILEVLVEFFKGTNLGEFLEERLISTTSEEYKKALSKFEEEVERIKLSIQGYKYKDKIEKIKEINEFLNTQRIEIDSKVNDNLILPK